MKSILHEANKHNQYAAAGVDIDAGQRAVNLMKDAIKATYTAAVLSNTGNFGGLFDISALKTMDAPVLVASTDGVGTKTKVAAALGRWDTIGQDLVNHCINDILVQGAQPLFFLDYVASSKLEPEPIAAIVQGVAVACTAAGCALLGGETAEMPGVYVEGEVDVVGTIIGVVDKSMLLDGSRIQPGDAILSLPSTGLHTNGYSLARHILRDLNWHSTHDALGESIGDALLAVHHCYLPDIQAMREADVTIHGFAHITGGGVIDNLPRILPDGLGAIIERGNWNIPHLFELIQSLGEVDEMEMYRVFNMGMGMLVVLPEAQVHQALAALPDARRVGRIFADSSGVTIR
ncbi:MAG: phosphoribosylformylglycinamidine cyclo-ligase [Chloroflexi bacterium]|nr:phosphoribosylformylglycinamidine cyclo-ligase [Chloroflexota bacterium]